MSCDRKNVCKKILIVLIFVTLGFIFIQSTVPPRKSVAESDKVGEMVGSVISPDTPFGSFIQDNIRKIAHFLEFFILGTEVSLFVSLFHSQKMWFISSYVFAFFVGFFDETVQIFSKRGHSIADVWLDFFGFAAAASLVYLAFYLRRKIKSEK